MMYRQWLVLCVFIVTICFAGNSVASVVIAGTRIIFSSEEKEVTIKLNNEGKVPSLVQVWLDKGNRDTVPGDVKVPFVLTPPLFRLDPNKGQTLRMLYTKEPLPADRESIFWLNVLEIPPKGASDKDEESNLIQMAFRTRIKVFYRPAAFDTQAQLEAAYSALTWAIKPDDHGGYLVEANNPTPYFMTVTKVSVSAQQRHAEVDQGDMIAPFQKKQFHIKDKQGLPSGPYTCTFSLLNDYGSEVSLTSSAS
jgi:chaperone protein EcpD